MIFKPLSWGIDLGYEHFKDQSDYLKIKPEMGFTFGNEKNFIYTMIGSNVYYKDSDQLYSLGSSVGFIINQFDDIKLGFRYSYDRYNKSLENNEFEISTTYKIEQNIALNIKYINDNLYKEDKERIKAGVFYYF